jgi:predicted alpha/beta-hydrolase family hydrolase
MKRTFWVLMRGRIPGRRRWRRRDGQALTEFVVVMASLLLALVMVSLFLYTFREYGGRVLNLVASEYP